MRLLIVEDEPRISEIIKAALERAEFAVDTVRLRADAQEALANTAYDAAILDLGLPRFVAGSKTVGPGFSPVDCTCPMVSSVFVLKIVSRAAPPLLIKPRFSSESITVK